MPRTRDAEATRAALLEAARRQFGRLGYDATTTRSVAAEVGVDPALVARYFGSKQGLFAEAAELLLDLPDLSDVPVGKVAELVLPRFFEAWEDGGAFLPLLRAAATGDEAQEAMLAVFTGQVAPVLSRIAVDRPAERAAMVASQMLGLAFARYVLRIPPLATMSRERAIGWLAPVIRRYLTGPAPGAARQRRQETMSR